MFKVIIPHRDAVFDGLIFPHEPCASDRSRVSARLPLRLAAAVRFLARPFQPPHGLRFLAAMGQFLDAIGKAAFEVAAVEGGWLALEQLSFTKESPLASSVSWYLSWHQGKLGRRALCQPERRAIN